MSKLPTTPAPGAPEPAPATAPAFKSRGGLRRAWHATGHSLAGLRAAVRHEAAFRHELALGLPLMLLAPWLAPGRWQLLAMVGSVDYNNEDIDGEVARPSPAAGPRQGPGQRGGARPL